MIIRAFSKRCCCAAGTPYRCRSGSTPWSSQQAEDAFNKRATGRGRTGNWRSQLNRLQIDRYRANVVEWHLRCRRRFGRHHVSGMAALDGHGTPSDKHPSENIVTLQDILEFLAQKFQGTPYQGGAGAIAKSYKKMKGLRIAKQRWVRVAPHLGVSNPDKKCCS